MIGNKSDEFTGLAIQCFATIGTQERIHWAASRFEDFQERLPMDQACPTYAGFSLPFNLYHFHRALFAPQRRFLVWRSIRRDWLAFSFFRLRSTIDLVINQGIVFNALQGVIEGFHEFCSLFHSLDSPK